MNGSTVVSLSPWAMRTGAAIFRFGFWASRIVFSSDMSAPGRIREAGANPPNSDGLFNSPRHTWSTLGNSASARSEAISFGLICG